jgi:hypothetical protein
MTVGSVRVVSKRKGGVEPVAGETVVDVDRTNPVLGNEHILHNQNDAGERDRVIEAYAADLAADLMARGPMSREIEALGERVGRGERLALRCWCAPRKCHADLLARLVAKAGGVEVTVE